MTGNIRQGLGLLVVAALAALIWFVLRNSEVGELLALVAIILAAVGLVRIAADLLRPQRD